MRSHVCTRLAKGAGEKKSGCSTYRFRHNCQQTEDCQFQTQAERMLHTDPPSHAGHCKTTNVSRFESDVNSCTCLHASPQGKPRMCACLLGMLERRGIYPHGARCLERTEHEDMIEEQDAQTQTVVCGSFQRQCSNARGKRLATARFVVSYVLPAPSSTLTRTHTHTALSRSRPVSYARRQGDTRNCIIIFKNRTDKFKNIHYL